MQHLPVLPPVPSGRGLRFAPWALAAVVSLLAVFPTVRAQPAAASAAAPASAPLGSGIDLAGRDPAVRPQDDLFRAVNGQWLRNTPIPGDKVEYGTFVILRDRADARVRAIVESLAADDAAQGNERKIGDFYRSYLDTAAIDRAGLSPVKPWFARIDAARSPRDLAQLFGSLQGAAATPLALLVGPDDKAPDTYRLQTWQGGLGLPDRDYYLKDDPRFSKARDAYRVYLRALLAQAGERRPEAMARRVFALEHRLARAQWAAVDNRDPQKLYNLRPTASLATSAPGLDWSAMFAAAAVPPQDTLIVSQPDYVTALGKAVQDTPLPVWKAYLKVRLLDSQALVLPRPVRDARFAFRGQALGGLTEDRPRWQRAIAALDDALGEAVGQVYVQRHFPPQNKARMQALVDNLVAAYRGSIDSLTWMGPKTKQRAHEKLSKYASKIGYPEVWRDYTRVQVRPGDAFGNAVRAGRAEHERLAVRAGGRVDRREWQLTPQNVNAYYHPNFNEIVFPAAILEPPFFDVSADDAANYGAIGAIIGHEISHGFDDQGSQYDGDGRLSNWWTDADRRAFDALAKQLVAQFAGYQPLPGKPLNGQLTLGENIADLSGLQIAYKAWKLSLGGRPSPVIDGLSGEQRFFMGWAQAWREKTREERVLQLLTMDPHSPPEFRANGAAVNTDGFHDAFSTKPGDKLFKPVDQRLRIW